jgi:hypothetical protein
MHFTSKQTNKLTNEQKKQKMHGEDCLCCGAHPVLVPALLALAVCVCVWRERDREREIAALAVCV